ncbi:hypothetical protein PG993_004789 [Apiospora rasikravindrae]|uniref:Major facilitator superfamily (MFS) profile domain-containing protein n=1 Tax=Apiospora rasikravindrae TaxID=990691 RepID=A0ABR1TFR2_9PEZI
MTSLTDHWLHSSIVHRHYVEHIAETIMASDAHDPGRPLLSAYDRGETAETRSQSNNSNGSFPGSPSGSPSNQYDASRERLIQWVLPIAFTAAFAIAATSATTVFAYASIVCADAVHCRDEERGRYVGVVAMATTVANAFGLVAVVALRPWTESRPKVGLYFWFLCRALGIAMLAVGVPLHNIHVAVAARVFEGLATDNLLQYALAAIYVQTQEPGHFSRLMATSLALYMLGMSLSPTLVTFLPDFQLSFVLAISLIALSIVYLWAFVPLASAARADGSSRCSGRDTAQTISYNIRRRASSIMEPIYIFYREPVVALPGLAILLYNTSQAYLFPLIMVYASLQFNFSSIENGYIVSMAAATSSMYLFFTVYVIPRARQRLFRSSSVQEMDGIDTDSRQDEARMAKPSRPKDQLNKDLVSALASMALQVAILPLCSIVQAAETLYGLIVLISLGLASPSFIKSYTIMRANQKDSAVAGLAVAEVAGGFLSPVILGTIQSKTSEGQVFIIISAMVGTSMLFLMGSLFMHR